MVNPIERLPLIFSIILAYLFLKERVTWQVIRGAALTAIDAVIIALAKNLLKLN